MSWDKIQDHLFDKYCVEGYDPELERLMKEYDKEIQEQVLSKIKQCIDLLDDCLYDKDEINLIQSALNEIVDKLCECEDKEEVELE